MHVSSQTSIYLGNIKLPGKIFIGAISVVKKTPVKTIKRVSVKNTLKKLSAVDDIYIYHEYKLKQEELRIVFKFSIIIIM
ncbi:unnamed protein product [marine sediment metagenome]|uniref:Uncharacterized protein n=1 Tax=marine sediment metagenome TaxID=412755 RepID=X1CM53_9ZZZZ